MKNPHIDSLIEKLENLHSSTSMADWICQNTTLAGAPFSFKRHEFQRQILDDLHPHLCCKKLSQVGLTEGQVRKTIGFLQINQGRSALYTFPDREMRDRQGKTRVKPIFDRDFPVTSRAEIRNSSILQLGDSFLYLAGNSEGDATSTSVDMIMNDELDLSDQEIIALFASRLQASDFKIRQQFSTPTYSGFGISLEYESSDQHEYFYKCEHCGHWHVPLYNLESVYIPGLPKNIETILDIDYLTAIGLDYDSSYVRCPKCGKPIDISDCSSREWVPTYPSRVHSRGYQVRPFSSGLLSIKYLVTTMAEYIKKGQLRRGLNTVLGEDYEASNSRMQESKIRSAFQRPFTPEISPEKPMFIGIDVGLVCHLTLYSDGNIFVFERIPYDRLKARVKHYMEKYNILQGAIDRYPYTSLANELRDETNHKIMPVVYVDTPGKEADPKMEVDKSVTYYNIYRTAALDRVQEGINGDTLKLWGYDGLEDIIVEHYRDMVREDEAGSAPKWVKLNGNDHFFHASSYAMAAEKIYYVEKLRNEEEEETRSVVFAAQPQEFSKNKKSIDIKNLTGYSSSSNLRNFSGFNSLWR